jgi:hypothetical protein
VLQKMFWATFWPLFSANSSGHPGNVVIAPNLYLRLPTVREKFKKPEQEFLQPQPQLVDVGETAP